MIQRIQTVYLALVAVLSILGLCLPLAQYYVGTAQVASFNSFTYTAAEGYDAFGSFSVAPLAFSILMGIVILLTIVSIILNCLAIHGIRKDEALVRSLDRLR